MQLKKTLPWMVLALLLSEPAAAARTDWREMTVGHFHLYSTLRDSKTREVARQLQAFAKTVGTFLQGEDRLPDVPTNIYILDNGDLAFDEVKGTVFNSMTRECLGRLAIAQEMLGEKAKARDY